MKKAITLCICITLLVVCKSVAAQETKKASDTTFSKTFVDNLKKVYSDSLKIYTDSLKKVSKGAAQIDSKKWFESKPVISLTVVIAFFLVMIILLSYFFKHIKENKQRIGYQSIKLIGLILIFPGICILAIVGGTEILSGNTLAVLLGTIAGYVLSREDDSKETSSKENDKLKEEHEKAEQEFKKRISELEGKIKVIKEKNPALVE